MGRACSRAGAWAGTPAPRASSEGLAALRAQGAYARQPYYLSLLAETLLDAGETGRAGAVLDDALGAATERDDLWWMPELLRLKARTADPSAAR